MKKLAFLLTIIILFCSCSEYQKALKTEDVARKFEVATNLYEKNKLSKAILLFEQIAPTYRGKPQAEKMFYMYGMSLYKSKQYYSAGYQLESFVSSYPKSEKVEEIAFLAAKSYSMLSPEYTQDQTDTTKAIGKLQNFIDQYPTSTYLADANKTLQSLTGKIEKKVFENAKQYNTISDYKSAIIALDNFIADFPGTPYKEEALYYKLDSAFLLAENSIPSKMKERFESAKIAHSNLLKFNSNTVRKDKADIMLAAIESKLQQFQK